MGSGLFYATRAPPRSPAQRFDLFQKIKPGVKAGDPTRFTVKKRSAVKNHPGFTSVSLE
jgi:hypothetical protein